LERTYLFLYLRQLILWDPDSFVNPYPIHNLFLPVVTRSSLMWLGACLKTHLSDYLLYEVAQVFQIEWTGQRAIVHKLPIVGIVL